MRFVGAIQQPGADANVSLVVPTKITEATDFGIQLNYVRMWMDSNQTRLWAAGSNAMRWEAIMTLNQSGFSAVWPLAVMVKPGGGVDGSLIIECQREWYPSQMPPPVVDTDFTVALVTNDTTRTNTLYYLVEYTRVPMSMLEITQKQADW